MLTLEAGSGIEALTAAFGFVTTCMTQMATTIISQPLFLVPVGIGVAGAAIGLCGRLLGN